MAFVKRWIGTTGDYSLYTNWAKISIRNSGYSWTASGSGTNEYYLRTSGNANPNIGGQPGTVYINGTSQAEGTVGSLANLGWDYADNDTLGYSTIYIRLNAGDPDSQALDYVQFQAIPVATDDVRIPADSGTITSGLNQSAVAIVDFIVEQGYNENIGSSTEYLRIDPDKFEFSATDGTAYIDLGTASSIAPQIYSTGQPVTGERGLYLLGSSIGVLNVAGGHVGVAVRAGETATVATARVMNANASLWLGEGVSLTTWQQHDGGGILRCAATTVLIYDGDLLTQEAGAITTVNQKGGDVVHNSTGTVTTWNLYGGTIDLQQSGAARTISTLNKYLGNWQVLHNKEAVTVTTETRQDSFTETATV